MLTNSNNEAAEKPYVVCHMLTSIDGKIDGELFSCPKSLTAVVEYGNIRGFYNCGATLYGTTTMLGGYAAGKADKLPKSAQQLKKEDYMAPNDIKNYIVSLDPKGILAFDSPYSERKGRPKAHIIEVLTDKASSDYLAYLQKVGISYIFAGKDKFDCSVLLHKLKTVFGINRLMIAGGGVTNWSFAAESLIDELSIIIAPVADGGTKSVSVFEQFGDTSHPPVPFTLKEAKAVQGNAVWLRYIKSI